MKISYDDALYASRIIFRDHPGINREGLCEITGMSDYMARKVIKALRDAPEIPGMEDSLPSYFRTDLPHYLDRRGPLEPDQGVEALAELARGCAREGWPVLVSATWPAPGRCASCDSTSNVLPQRMTKRERLHCVLLCDSCQRRMNDPRYRGTVYNNVKVRTDTDAFQQVLLLKEGQRIRMVSGRKLEMEVLV